MGVAPRGGRQDRLERMVRATLTAPGKSLARLSRSKGTWWDSISFALWCFLYLPAVVGGAGALVLLLRGLLTADLPRPADILFGTGMAAILAPLAVNARVLMLSGAEHLVLKILGGAREPYDTSLRAHCFCSGPALFLPLPIVGLLLGEAWQAGLRIATYQRVHQTSKAKAAIAVLLPMGLVLAGYTAVFVLPSVL
ncbi:MAG: YIP1 family protein [Myxococcales bacterium]